MVVHTANTIMAIGTVRENLQRIDFSPPPVPRLDVSIAMRAQSSITYRARANSVPSNPV